MSKPCSVCTHEQVESFNRELVDLQPFRQIGARYGLSKSALSRHARAHPLTSRGVMRRGNRRAGIYRAQCPYCCVECRIFFHCYDCPKDCPTVVYGQEPVVKKRKVNGTKRRYPMKEGKVLIPHEARS